MSLPAKEISKAIKEALELPELKAFPTLQGDLPELRDAYFQNISDKIIMELQKRGEAVTDIAKSFEHFEKAYPDDFSAHMAPEVLGTTFPKAILDVIGKRVVVNPFASFGEKQNLLVDLLGTCMTQRLLLRNTDLMELMPGSPKINEVYSKLLKICEKLGVEEKHLIHIRSAIGDSHS